MRKLYKNRPRLLIISCKDDINHQLNTLLSGYNYQIDLDTDLEAGFNRFRAYRHQVILIDECYLGNQSSRVTSLFKKVQRYSIIIALVPAYKPDRIEDLLSEDVYDVLETPVFPERLHQQIRRVIAHQRVIVSFNYLRFLILFAALIFGLAFQY